MNNDGFIAQMDLLSEKMLAAYYLHLYSFSALPVSQRSLPPFITSGGTMISVPADTNAGTYAVIAGLAAIDQQNIPLILDNSSVNGLIKLIEDYLATTIRLTKKTKSSYLEKWTR